VQIDGAHDNAKKVRRDESELRRPKADDTHDDAVDSS
jgi:hypothetical protein